MPSAAILTTERLALLGQLVRYGITGLFASVVNIGIYHVGYEFGHLSPNLAWTLGFVGAATVGYIIHSRWSFRGHGERAHFWRQTVRFMVVSLVSFGLNSFWVWLLVRHWGLEAWTPDPLALTATPLVVFWLNRQWVFR